MSINNGTLQDTTGADCALCPWDNKNYFVKDHMAFDPATKTLVRACSYNKPKVLSLFSQKPRRKPALADFEEEPETARYHYYSTCYRDWYQNLDMPSQNTIKTRLIATLNKIYEEKAGQKVLRNAGQAVKTDDRNSKKLTGGKKRTIDEVHEGGRICNPPGGLKKRNNAMKTIGHRDTAVASVTTTPVTLQPLAIIGTSSPLGPIVPVYYAAQQQSTFTQNYIQGINSQYRNRSLSVESLLEMLNEQMIAPTS